MTFLDLAIEATYVVQVIGYAFGAAAVALAISAGARL